VGDHDLHPTPGLNSVRAFQTRAQDIPSTYSSVHYYFTQLLLYLGERMKKIMESFEMWRWRRMKKIGWNDSVRNYYRQSMEERYILHTKK